MTKFKRFISLLMLAVLLTANIFVVQGTTAHAESPQSTPSGIPFSELERFVDAHVAQYIGNTIVGTTIIIMQNGEVLLNSSYGYANTASGVLVDDNTVFEWASVGKLLTWVSVMQLVEQGYLDLNADIRTHLPDNFFRRLQFDTPITMYNLMHHNAGWGMRVTDFTTHSERNFVGLGEALRRAEPNQMFQPGTVVAYSNYGVALAGYIVERITGQPFHEYVNENIFAVLGMNNTATHPYQADNPSLSERHGETQGYGQNMRPSHTSGEILLLYPAGATVGTAADMAKFLAALTPNLGEASPLFHNATTLNEMLSTSYSFGEAIPSMAHGFFEELLSVRTLGHTGSLLHSASRLAFSPACGFGFIMVTNTDNLDFGPGLATALFGEFVPNLYAGTLPNISNLNNLTGWYGSAMRLENRGFMQMIGAMPMPSERIRIVDENTLAFKGMEFTQTSPFAFRANSEPFMLHLIVENNTVDRVLLVSDTVGVVTAGAVLEFTSLPMAFVVKFYLTMVLMVITGFILLDYGVVKAISKKIKNRKKPVPFTTVERLVTTMGILFVIVNVNYIVMMMRATAFASTNSALLPHFMLNIAYMVAATALSGFTIWNMKKTKAELTGKNKVITVLSSASSIIFVAIMALWEFYR